jgi:uncharacterized membrane protein (UPF0127 family)
MPSFLSPLLRDPRRAFELRNVRTGAVAAPRVRAALDSKTRNRGLLGLDRMPDGEALVIAPTNAIHTWFMRFPIDVAFVARSGDILKICARMPAWRLAASFRAFAVIEFAAGALAACGTERGDRLALEPAGAESSTSDQTKAPRLPE